MSDKPLCWTCKHGLCVEQVEKAVVISTDSPNKESDDSWKPAEAKDENSGQAEVKCEGYNVICFWNPYRNKDVGPVQFEDVKNCNRYEKNTPKRDLPKDDPEL